MKARCYTAAICALLLFLTSCGGGGSGGGPNTPTGGPPPVQCEDGTTVPAGQFCPVQPPVQCEDGTTVPAGQSCPVQPPVQCEDGTTVPAGQSCPVQPPGPQPSALKINTSFGTTSRDHYPLNAKFSQSADNPYCCWNMEREESDIASRADVWAMLRENAYRIELENESIASSSIIGHMSAPVVRPFSDAPRESRAALLRAIDNINAWLPWNKHITIGADIPSTYTGTREALLVELFALADQLAYAHSANASEADLAALERQYQETDSRISRLDASVGLGDGGNYITANMNATLEPSVAGTGSTTDINIDRDSNQDVHVIQHELLHSMGMIGGRACHEKFGADCNINSLSGPMWAYVHVPVSQFPESSMAYASPYDDTHGLSQIDGETIQVIYTRLHGTGEKLQVGWGSHFEIRSEHLSVADLGPWDDSIIRIEGRFDRNPNREGRDWEISPAFGIDWRNGMARPWANGRVTYATFAASGLTGNATWTGGLVGFTPIQEAVHGDSEIAVNLVNMKGNAAFTALEHWGAGAAPGARGTGAQWNDGDLHYSLSLNGNYLRSNDGAANRDEGYVSGRFVGGRHEAVVGILERPDLTAAFGGHRE